MNKDKEIEKLQKEIVQTRKMIKIVIFFGLIWSGLFFYWPIWWVGGLLLAFLMNYLHKPMKKSSKILNKEVILDDSDWIFRSLRLISENKFEIQEIFSIAWTHINNHIYEYKIEWWEVFSRLISLVNWGFKEVEENIILKDKIKEKYNDRISSKFLQNYDEKILNLESKSL